MKRNCLIYGFGISGEWAYKLALNKKCFDKIFLYDEKEEGVKKAFEMSKTVPGVYVLETLNTEVINDVDTMILSPGVSIYDKWVKIFKKEHIKNRVILEEICKINKKCDKSNKKNSESYKKCCKSDKKIGKTCKELCKSDKKSMKTGKDFEVISELEFASRFYHKKLVAVTGTNGKTTCVKMLNHVLNYAKKGQSVAVGNVGYPFSRAIVEGCGKKIFVCEVSSFQLEAIRGYKPFIACVTNVTEDHINRHGTFLNYKRTKLKIAKNLNKGQYFVCKTGLYKLKKRKFDVYWFGRNNKGFGCFCKDDSLYFRNKKGEEKICRLDEINLPGEHNLENVMAVVNMAKLLKVKTKFILDGIKTFRLDRHRIETVFEKDGVKFVDDSKATNVDAVVRAVECFDKNKIILLLGGSDKGFVFDNIFKNLKGNVKEILCFGEVGKKLEDSAKKFGVEVDVVKTLKEATDKACFDAKDGDVVLLSPANASFDEFKNYKDRGDKFLEYIKEFFEKDKT